MRAWLTGFLTCLLVVGLAGCSDGGGDNTPVTPSGFAVSLSVNPDEGFTDTFFQLHVIVINASDDQAYENYQARWDFDGDGVYDTPYGDKHFMRHQYAQPGTYNPRIEVRDDHGVFAVAGSMVVVTRENAVPAAVLPWVNPESGTTATEFQLGCTVYDSNDQLGFSGAVRWDWEDDGSYDTPFVAFATSERAAADHIAPVFTYRYATPGDKRARVQAIAPSGRVATNTILIPVR